MKKLTILLLTYTLIITGNLSAMLSKRSSMVIKKSLSRTITYEQARENVYNPPRLLPGVPYDTMVANHYRAVGCCPCEKDFSECIKTPTGDECLIGKNIRWIKQELMGSVE